MLLYTSFTSHAGAAGWPSCICKSWVQAPMKAGFYPAQASSIPEVLFCSQAWRLCARKVRNPGIVIKTIITRQEWMTQYILKLDVWVQAHFNTLKFQNKKGFCSCYCQLPKSKKPVKIEKDPICSTAPPSLLNLQCLWDCLAAITQIQKSPPSPIKLQQQWSHSAPG